MLTLGPLSLPAGLVILFGAYLAAEWVAGMAPPAADGSRAPTVWLRALIVGVLVARAAFVLRYLNEFRMAPISMLDISDRGFIVWPGLLAALAVLGRALWRHPLHRRALLAGAVTGLTLFVGGQFAAQRWLAPDHAPLPALTLSTLAGEPVVLGAGGKPRVINLWATWCPHCRREMAALTDMQHRYPQAEFVFADQGEDAATVSRYLQTLTPPPANVLLDPDSALLAHINSRSLPATLFVHADGRIESVHLGVISRAGVAQGLERLRAQH